MIFKHFRINIVLRVLLLVLAVFVFEYIWDYNQWPPTRIFFAGGIVFLVVDLIRYVEKTNRDLNSFLMAIKHKDFTHTFTTEKRGKSFAALKDAFNQIIRSYQDLRAEKESHYQYLQNIIEHVKVALICYGDEGKIELMNKAAKDLLDRPYMSNISILERVNPKLLDSIINIDTGERQLVKAVIGEELLNIAVQATEFKLQGKHYKLVSLQDIRTELDEKEIDTWQKLIRVLTHEIMNSVTPIISLTKVISTLMTDEHEQRKQLTSLTEEEADDILDSVRTIESRSKGLLHFVHAYRNLTKIQKPNFREINVDELIERVVKLMNPELGKRNISCVYTHPTHEIKIHADVELIEQVLINLVKNAMEALEGQENPKIEFIVSQSSDQKVVLQVKDNGAGINAEYIDKIFIPFFTTKKKGSGIGLSLSRQIMRMHKGSINFHTEEEGGTVFTLIF